MRKDEVFDFLSRNGWLADTPSQFRIQILEKCRVVRVEAGDDIYKLQESSGGIWGLADGALYFETAVGDGVPRVSFYHHPGFWTGLAAIVLNSSRKAGFFAARPSVLAYLSRTEFERLVREDHDTWRWMSLLATTNNILSMSVAYDLMNRSQTARICALLLQLGGCRAKAADKTPEILMSQDTLAGIVGLSRSALNEILRELANKQWISLGYRKLRIINDASLRKRADEEQSHRLTGNRKALWTDLTKMKLAASATKEAQFRLVFSQRRAARLNRFSLPTACSMRARTLQMTFAKRLGFS